MRSILYHPQFSKLIGIRMPPLADRVSRARLLQPAFLGTVAWLIVLSTLAWALAVLFWAQRDAEVPSPTPRHESDPRKVAAMLVQRTQPTGSAPAAVLAASPVSKVQRHVLVGIASGFGTSSGFVLIESDGKPAQAVVLGESLADGQRLVFVGHDHAVLEKDGKGTRLSLAPPTKNSSESSTSSSGTTPARTR